MTLSQPECMSPFWKTHVWNHLWNGIMKTLLMYPDKNLDLVTKNLTESSSIQLSPTVQSCAHHVHFYTCTRSMEIKLVPWLFNKCIFIFILLFPYKLWFSSGWGSIQGKNHFTLVPWINFPPRHLLLPVLFCVFRKSWESY